MLEICDEIPPRDEGGGPGGRGSRTLGGVVFGAGVLLHEVGTVEEEDTTMDDVNIWIGRGPLGKGGGILQFLMLAELLERTPLFIIPSSKLPMPDCPDKLMAEFRWLVLENPT